MREVLMLLLGGLFGWLGRVYAERLHRRELFDHQLRLEKEYQIYSDLWERLFDFRIAAHGLVDSLQDRVHENAHGTFIDTFNAYQAVVRRNEPFIVPPVFQPARAIVSYGRAIAMTTLDLGELHKQRERCRDWAAADQFVDKMIGTDQEREEAVEEIDRLFEEVKDAIQKRILVTPPRGNSPTSTPKIKRSEAKSPVC